MFLQYCFVCGLLSCSLPVILVRDCGTICSLVYTVLILSFRLVSGFYFPGTLAPISLLGQSMIPQFSVLSTVYASFAWVALIPRYLSSKPNDYESDHNRVISLLFWTTEFCYVLAFQFHTLISLEFCWHGYPISDVRQSKCQGILNV